MFFWLRILLLLLIALPASGELVAFPGRSLIIDEENDLMWLDYPKASRNWPTHNSAASSSTDQGFIDWRLPTSAELLDLQTDYTLSYLDDYFKFGPVRNWVLWSSTSALPLWTVHTTRYYVVSFLDNNRSSIPQYSSFPALFTRDVPDYYLKDSSGNYVLTSEGDFIDSGD